MSRISQILSSLTEMSRDWSRWNSNDWQPLELELRQLLDQKGEAKMRAGMVRAKQRR